MLALLCSRQTSIFPWLQVIDAQVWREQRAWHFCIEEPLIADGALRSVHPKSPASGSGTTETAAEQQTTSPGMEAVEAAEVTTCRGLEKRVCRSDSGETNALAAVVRPLMWRATARRSTGFEYFEPPCACISSCFAGDTVALAAVVQPLMWRNTKALVALEGTTLPSRTLKVI